MLRLLLILLGLSLSLDTRSLFPLTRGLELSADIVRRSQEYRHRITANNALEEEIKFLKTKEGARWATYRYLGMVKPGQQVGRVGQPPVAAAKPLTQPQRVRSWIVETEEAGARTLDGLGETLACYGGLRPLDQAPPERNQPPQKLSKKTGSTTGQ